MLPPMLAPTTGQQGQIQSSADHSRQAKRGTPETTKPRKTLDFPGFSTVGDTELESVTSTMSTSECLAENTGKIGVKAIVAHRLHQCLHQLAESADRAPAELLIDVIAQTLGAEVMGILLERLDCTTHIEME